MDYEWGFKPQPVESQSTMLSDYTTRNNKWCERWESNPHFPTWQAGSLSLTYSRKWCDVRDLNPQYPIWKTGMLSNYINIALFFKWKFMNNTIWW